MTINERLEIFKKENINPHIDFSYGALQINLERELHLKIKYSSDLLFSIDLSKSSSVENAIQYLRSASDQYIQAMKDVEELEKLMPDD